jgi:hypothetical protein
MAKNDTVKRLGDEVCNDYLGFTPTSNSTKPPHIANGLFREVSGEVCDFRDVHEWIVSERKKDAISSEKIIEKYKDVLWQGENEEPANIKQVRFLLDDIFNPDNTVYPSYDFSAANISSHWLVKGSVAPEAKIGKFIFGILSKQIKGKRSPAIELIQIALNEDSDDLTKIIKPIIVFPSEDEKRDVRGVSYPSEEDIKWDACKATIRKGFDNLANNMIKIGDNKNSLLVLERMVNYSCFATFYYLINVNASKSGGLGSPILIDAGEDIESIKKASEHCYSYAKTSVEDYYIASINSILHKEVTQDNKSACVAWINQIVFSNDSREKEISSALNSYFESFCDDGDNPIHALAHALQIILYTFDYKNNSPSEFCRVLGVRGGLIGPRGNRAKVKRYLVNSFSLETITYSILSGDDIEDGIELKDLSRKATEAYHILLGADVDSEYRILEAVNIAQNTPGDLRGDMALNSQRIADIYISLGMAHRYADGVTMIGRRK